MRTTRATARAESVIFDENAVGTPVKPTETPKQPSLRQPLGEILDNPKQIVEGDVRVVVSMNKEAKKAGKRSTRKGKQAAKQNDEEVEETGAWMAGQIDMTENLTTGPSALQAYTESSDSDAGQSKMVDGDGLNPGLNERLDEVLADALSDDRDSSWSSMSETTDLPQGFLMGPKRGGGDDFEGTSTESCATSLTRRELFDIVDIDSELNIDHTQARDAAIEHDSTEYAQPPEDQFVLDGPSALAILVEMASLDKGLNEAEQKLQQIFYQEREAEEASNVAKGTSHASRLLRVRPITPAAGYTEAIPTLQMAAPIEIESVSMTANKPIEEESPAEENVLDEKDIPDTEKKLVAEHLTVERQKPLHETISSAPTTSTPAKKSVTALRKKRVTISALNTPPPVVKSTKPLTKSTFHLHSDEVAAKLKLQREERLKRREQAEAQKKLESKPKAILKPIKPAGVKTTTASRARMSLMVESKQASQADQSNTKTAPSTLRNRASTLRTAARPSLASKTVSPRHSMHEFSILDNSSKAMPPKSTVRQSILKSATIPARSNRTAPARVSIASAGHRPHVKEVFNRGKVDLEEQQKTIQEKAEALKKAREEAAERGRLASQAWASKKRGLAVGKPIQQLEGKENVKPVLATVTV